MRCSMFVARSPWFLDTPTLFVVASPIYWMVVYAIVCIWGSYWLVYWSWLSSMFIEWWGVVSEPIYVTYKFCYDKIYCYWEGPSLTPPITWCTGKCISTSYDCALWCYSEASLGSIVLLNFFLWELTGSSYVRFKSLWTLMAEVCVFLNWSESIGYEIEKLLCSKFW